MRVVVPGDDPPQIQESSQLEKLRARAEIDEVLVFRDRPQSAAELVARADGAQIVINSRGAVRWPAEVLRRLPELRLIATCSIGTDMIDLQAAHRCGVVVSNQPGRTAPVVAEHAFGLMFALAKHAAYHTVRIRAGDWPRTDGVYLQGKRLGIVGTGDTGAEMARLGNAVGMEVMAWTFAPHPERAARLGVRYVELDELLAASDVVSLHLRLSEQSRSIIGARQLAMMKPGALLINTARAGTGRRGSAGGRARARHPRRRGGRRLRAGAAGAGRPPSAVRARGADAARRRHDPRGRRAAQPGCDRERDRVSGGGTAQRRDRIALEHVIVDFTAHNHRCAECGQAKNKR